VRLGGPGPGVVAAVVVADEPCRHREALAVGGRESVGCDGGQGYDRGTPLAPLEVLATMQERRIGPGAVVGRTHGDRA
jgi:hypothetical protein